MKHRFYSTKEAATILSIRADTLQRAVWLGKVKQPMKSPSGQYLWTSKDIESAAWTMGRTKQFTEYKGGLQ